MKKNVRIGISGAGGRMGRMLLELACNINKIKGGLTDALEYTELAVALEHAKHPLLGADAAMFAGPIGAISKSADEKSVKFSDSFDPESVDIFIDFSTPAAAVALSQQCRKHKIPMVVGVTGFSKAEEKELQAASADIPLLISPNMSAGMLFMFDIVKTAAELFKHGGDVEICETHHRGKRDHPSGTALRLGKIIAEEIGVPFDDAAVFDRQQRQGETRGKNEIGFSSIRAGDIIGEHRVIFATDGEQIEIIHRTTNRGAFAFGAILAAALIVDKPPGLYSMQDIVDEVKELTAKNG